MKKTPGVKIFPEKEDSPRFTWVAWVNIIEEISQSRHLCEFSYFPRSFDCRKEKDFRGRVKSMGL